MTSKHGKFKHSQSNISQNHTVKENYLQGVYIENLSEHKVSSIEEAYMLYIYGLQKKKIFATVKNRESSRSHTVFQLRMCSTNVSLKKKVGTEEALDVKKQKNQRKRKGS
jgi:hypothetical protein